MRHNKKFNHLSRKANHRADLLKFRNFGKKSLTELDELLERNGLAFGMDISRYRLNEIN